MIPATAMMVIPVGEVVSLVVLLTITRYFCNCARVITQTCNLPV